MKEKFKIEGMSCAACQAHVQNAVSKLNGVNNVNVNLLKNTMDVDFDSNICNISIIEESVRKAGYKAISSKGNAIKVEKDYDLVKLIVSFVFLILIMYLSMSHMWGYKLLSFFEGKDKLLILAFTQFLLTLPVLFIYRNYFISGYKKLFSLKPNMDSLIALSASASIIYGIVAIFSIAYGVSHNDNSYIDQYYNNLYFESAAMILTLISFGKYLEKLSKKKTTKAIEQLMDLSPKKAIVLIGDNEVEIDISEVNKGDIIVVKKGYIIPVDGKVIYGAASIDQANITGESVPVLKQEGDNVFASTVAVNGYIKIEAIKVGEDTSIANIIKLVDEASSSKAPISKLADKVAGLFVPFVMGISVLSFVIFLLMNYPFNEVFNFGISVLVIACPCALGLATPVAIMVGTGKGAQNGLLIKNAEILEKSQYIKTIVLDKTGTLTVGKPMVRDVISYSNNFLEIAYSLELLSEHPLANSICLYCKENKIKNYEVESFQSEEGRGIKGYINGKLYRAGNIKYLNESNIENNIEDVVNKYSSEGKTPLIFFDEEKVIGIIFVSDVLKESSKAAIEELKKMGIRVVMLTGDNSLVANYIAREVGINEVYSEVLPLEKQQIITKLKTESKHYVAMVGDGVNDALALTYADLGISLGNGSDIAMESSDIVLIRNDIMDVKSIIDLSKRVFNTIKGNLFWAFFYNSIGIVLASGLLYPSLGIKLNPMIGSLAMSMSSVFVVLNALTINLFKPKNELKIKEKKGEKMKEVVIDIEGMMCVRCKAHVEKAISQVTGVHSYEVSLENNNAIVKCDNDVDVEIIKNSIIEAGYEVK